MVYLVYIVSSRSARANRLSQINKIKQDTQIRGEAGWWHRTPLKRQRQVDFCKFEASLVLQSKFQDSQGCLKETVSKKP